MKRTPEPELMDDPAQALAYARADFDAPHNHFISLFKEQFPDWPGRGCVLDLGCGPGDICRRFAMAFPQALVHGVDAARAMLDIGLADLHGTALAERIQLIQGYLPDAHLPRSHYDALISNSLLHHLHNPQVLWDCIRRYAAADAPVFVMDLRRPQSAAEAAALVATHAADEPQILRRDFQQSLHAAYRLEEIQQQLRQAGLDWLQAAEVGDRHCIVYGRRPRS